MEELLDTFPELQLQKGKETVVCRLSRHEMPSRPEVVRAYVEGRKFKTLKAEKDFDFQKLQPYIIPSQKRKKQLFCALTNRYMNRKPAEVALHLEGKRYKRAFEKYNAGQLTLFEEKLGKKVFIKTRRDEEEVDGLLEQMEVEGGVEEGEEGEEGGVEEGEEGRVEEGEEEYKGKGWIDQKCPADGTDSHITAYPASNQIPTKVSHVRKRRPVTNLYSTPSAKRSRLKPRKRENGKLS